MRLEYDHGARPEAIRSQPSVQQQCSRPSVGRDSRWVQCSRSISNLSSYLLLGSAVAVSGCVQLLDIPDDPQLAPEATQTRTQLAQAGSGGGLPESETQPKEPLDGDEAGSSDEDRSPDRLTSDEPTDGDTGSSNDGAEDLQTNLSGDAGTSDESFDAGQSPDDAGAPQDAAPTAPQPPPPECAGSGSLGPNQRCFRVLNEALSWENARVACTGLGEGWDLAVIRSAAVNDFAASLSGQELWIGATDAVSEGNWVWVTDELGFWLGSAAGGPVNGAFANWNADEPNGGGNSDCARLVPGLDGIWADLECEFDRVPLCEGPRL